MKTPQMGNKGSRKPKGKEGEEGGRMGSTKRANPHAYTMTRHHSQAQRQHQYFSALFFLVFQDQEYPPTNDGAGSRVEGNYTQPVAVYHSAWETRLRYSCHPEGRHWRQSTTRYHHTPPTPTLQEFSIFNIIILIELHDTGLFLKLYFFKYT